jgi:hypothetical protein
VDAIVDAIADKNMPARIAWIGFDAAVSDWRARRARVHILSGGTTEPVVHLAPLQLLVFRPQHLGTPTGPPAMVRTTTSAVAHRSGRPALRQNAPHGLKGATCMLRSLAHGDNYKISQIA